MKPSFHLASGKPDRFNLDLLAKSGDAQKAFVLIVGNPGVDDVILCAASSKDASAPVDFLGQKDFVAVCVENPSDLAIGNAGIMDLVRQYQQDRNTDLAAQVEQAEFKQQLEDNMRMINLSLPGKQGKVPATAYVFGQVSQPGQIDLQETTSGFLNDGGQEFADYTHRDSADQKFLAASLAAKAGGNLAVVFVDSSNALITTENAAIFHALQANMPQKAAPVAAAGKGLMSRLLSLRFG